jgi:MFS family permease
VSKNVWIVLGASVLFGVAFGIYEFVFPFYLKQHGMTARQMGVIFAVAAAVIFFVRIYAGHLSDRIGRKALYGWSLGLCASAHFLTPLMTTLSPLVLLKSLREMAVFLRESIHPVLLFEEDRARFVDAIGKTRGMEYLFQGGGTLLAGALVAVAGYGGLLHLGGALLAVAVVGFWALFRERGFTPPDDLEAGAGLRVWSDLPSKLKLLAVSGFVFNVGLACSHCFVMPLFFKDRFGVSELSVATILMLHRITIALPLVLAGLTIRGNHKAIYIAFVTLEGLTLMGGGLIPSFWPATIIWLMHDLIGAGVWVPVQSAYIQKFAREDCRGCDTSTCLAVGALGGILGPLLAAELYPLHLGAPFAVGGLLMIVSAGMLLRL